MEASLHDGMPNHRGIPLLNMVMSLSDAMDLVNPAVIDHHKQVAYIAQCIAREIGLSSEDRADVLWAGLLHDAGAFSLKERMEFLEFEADDAHRHGELGYRLMSGFEPLVTASQFVRFHHVRWNGGEGSTFAGCPVPLGSHIIHLADRIAVAAGPADGVLSRVDDVVTRVRAQSGKMFVPELVDAFAGLAGTYCFWLDAKSSSIRRIIENLDVSVTVRLDMDTLLSAATVFCRLIDFRSRFTSTHSRGVAATAKTIGRYAGLPEKNQEMLEVAGCLHDLGKLAVPLELIEKPGQFTPQDFDVMRIHPYHTFRVLENIEELREINFWASCHHERLNGSGYPFCYHASDLPAEARIIAVADVFTALREDRPYRPGMSERAALGILRDMVDDRLLDGEFASLLRIHFDEVDATRASIQSGAKAEYRLLWSEPSESDAC
jgi:HD-GYP domain-containing protein (c-di-GMP phosphodiesterase class II)